MFASKSKYIKYPSTHTHTYLYKKISNSQSQFKLHSKHRAVFPMMITALHRRQSRPPHAQVAPWWRDLFCVCTRSHGSATQSSHTPHGSLVARQASSRTGCGRGAGAGGLLSQSVHATHSLAHPRTQVHSRSKISGCQHSTLTPWLLHAPRWPAILQICDDSIVGDETDREGSYLGKLDTLPRSFSRHLSRTCENRIWSAAKLIPV